MRTWGSSAQNCGAALRRVEARTRASFFFFNRVRRRALKVRLLPEYAWVQCDTVSGCGHGQVGAYHFIGIDKQRMLDVVLERERRAVLEPKEDDP